MCKTSEEEMGQVYIPENLWTQNDGPKGKGGLRFKVWPIFGIYLRFLGFTIWQNSKKLEVVSCFYPPWDNFWNWMELEDEISSQFPFFWSFPFLFAAFIL